ncbi:hypothetical protein GGS23DRAFT_52194 [Durotheca rogersii]|uniref:uncharacterized protein n=1 Tax=Durotheca rogersii TaxID=419775 RepID=UPI00222082D7|nr:uncharacterized protein GGS23DRAFT_52194 [Durotheca rogersii]KAI5863088.1 hypothetical protein GGS23DRAFT_52194 [Durotheca rogersii]
MCRNLEEIQYVRTRRPRPQPPMRGQMPALDSYAHINTRQTRGPGTDSELAKTVGESHPSPEPSPYLLPPKDTSTGPDPPLSLTQPPSAVAASSSTHTTDMALSRAGPRPGAPLRRTITPRTRCADLAPPAGKQARSSPHRSTWRACLTNDSPPRPPGTARLAVVIALVFV